MNNSSVKTFWNYARVIVGSLLLALALFLSGFAMLDFVWTHFVVPNPHDTSLGDGVVVIGGGFLLGCTLGIAGFSWSPCRFWPSSAQKNHN